MNLTKTLQESDLAELTEELKAVDLVFTADREQHPMRRWEYALALRAYRVWLNDHHPITVGYDVGGAGSPFHRMLPLRIVDPDEPGACALEELVTEHNPHLADAVFCLSVLEHVEDLSEFLYHLSCLVAPGGLLFLTMDITTPGTEAHFAHMRQRIFTPGYDGSWSGIGRSLQLYDFSQLGESDWTYHGHTLYGSYSFASLAMVKRS